MGDEPVDNRPKYPSGKPISEHPSHAEILDNYAYWYSKCAEEQQETLEAMKDLHVFEAFKRYSNPKSKEDAVEKAIKWWMHYYPYEVKEFEFYLKRHKETLANAKGFSRDKAKLHMWQGSMPQTIKKLLETIDPDFFRIGSNGKNPGYIAFYKVYTKARIGGRHG